LELEETDIQLGKFLGEGVYSEVYQGSVYGTQVAVKKFKNQSTDPQYLAGIRKEVKIMKSIRHPNLLLFLGACTKPGSLMIVTELLDKSFHDIHSTYTLFQKLKMAKDAAKGISWLHSLQPIIIHRDLKPENILVDASGKITKVADFGLALVKDQSKQSREEMKKIRGSPAFMSPEALLGKELTPRTDVYSFGMILWELLTGQSPYESLEVENFEELIEEICVKNTREKIPSDCPSTLKKLISSCWKPNPEERPDFLHIISSLDDCLVEVAIKDEEAKQFWRKSFSDIGGESLKLEVKWDVFLKALSKYLKVSSSVKIWNAVQQLLNLHDEQDLVQIQNFGNLLKWFGPLGTPGSEDTFLLRVQDICSNRWFFGDISQKLAEEQLSLHAPGCFLIRFSSQPGNYTLSKLISRDGKKLVVHIRILHENDNYHFNLDGKEHQFSNLDDLVKDTQLDLKTPCPGSKYYASFRVKHNMGGGYINQM